MLLRLYNRSTCLVQMKDILTVNPSYLGWLRITLFKEKCKTVFKANLFTISSRSNFPVQSSKYRHTPIHFISSYLFFDFKFFFQELMEQINLQFRQFIRFYSVSAKIFKNIKTKKLKKTNTEVQGSVGPRVTVSVGPRVTGAPGKMNFGVYTLTIVEISLSLSRPTWCP